MKNSFKRFSTTTKKEIVRLDYNDLINPNKNLTKEIHSAYGKDGLGILAVRNIPNYLKIREEILEYAYKISSLKNKSILEKYKKPDIRYQIGWSDTSPNPEHKDIGDIIQGIYTGRIFDDTRKELPRNLTNEQKHANVWPDDNCELKGLKEKFIAMGKIMYSIPKFSLFHLDRYLQEVDPKFPKEFLSNFFNDFDSQSTLNCYFPYNNIPEHLREEYRNKVNWISWHRDFSGLTALARAKHFSPDGKEYKTGGGLLIKDRYGKEHHCEYEEDEVGLQIGDGLFVLSAGNLVSTPHAVKTQQVPDDIMRSTFVSFFDPRPHQIIKPGNGESIKHVYDKDPSRGLHSIEKELKEGVTFETFINQGVNNFFS